MQEATDTTATGHTLSIFFSQKRAIVYTNSICFRSFVSYAKIRQISNNSLQSKLRMAAQLKTQTGDNQIYE